jgi:hypothetical protein
VLLNDPQFVEAAKVLAEKAKGQHEAIDERLKYIYRLLTGRTPTQKEQTILMKLYESEYYKFKQQPEKMKGWLTAGEYRLAEPADEPALVATIVAASTIMNSDAFITRR